MKSKKTDTRRVGKRTTKTRTAITTSLVIFTIVALFAAACGRSDDSIETVVETVGQTSGEASDCSAATETEIGVTADTITILVMADIGSPLSLGLFQGSIDGVNAWANHINRNGGIACRQIEVIEWDSRIDAIETTNGFKEACEKAFVLVGSTSLFALNVEDLDTCEDLAGNPIGIPDIPERAVEPTHMCSPNVFSVAGGQGACPFSGQGERTYFTGTGTFKYVLQNLLPDAHGVFLIPSDVPSTIAALVPVARAAETTGIQRDDEFAVTGTTPQVAFGQFLSAMRDNDSNFAFNGSDDNTMLKWRKEALAQTGFEDVLWYCILSCYTQAFRDDPAAEGTYISLGFVPYHEREYNEDLDIFLTEIGDEFPASWAAAAWLAGRLVEDTILKIVETDGVNGLTRQRMFDELRQVREYDGRGWLGQVDISSGINSPCFVLVQVSDGAYKRVHPSEPGTLDCTPENLLEQSLDIQKEFGR